MQRINCDVVIAILLLVICGIFFWTSFEIRQPDYGTLKPSTWPRVILGVLSILSTIYLCQSLNLNSKEPGYKKKNNNKNILSWIKYWRNPICCFILFFLYLLSMPFLGMLIGGVSFVFLLLNFLDCWQRRNLILHGIIALASVGGMWSLFTYGLGVMLPTGIIFNPYG